MHVHSASGEEDLKQKNHEQRTTKPEEMDQPFIELLGVTISVLASQIYCYTIVTNLPKGPTRLLSILPIIYLFTILPFQFSLIHLRGISAFFLTWLSSFKLILLCFNSGPLSHPQTQHSLLNFILISSFPIKPKHPSSPNPQTPKSNLPQPSLNPNKNPKSQNPQTPKSNLPKPSLNPKKDPKSQNPKTPKSNLSQPSLNPKKDPKSQNPQTSKSNLPQPSLNPKTLLNIALKASLLALVIHLYKFKHTFHPKILLTLYCIHMFLVLEIILVTGAMVVRTLVDMDLEPQFNKPYLSTSLQDFWGRRWNLVVTNILRPTVYIPVRRSFAGKRWSWLPAMLATFLVSGVMHEVMFYYITLVKPSWEVTWFFVLHGFSTAGEIAVKRGFPARFRLYPVVSSGFTFGYLLMTGFWLFFPPITRYGTDLEVLAELDGLMEFLAGKFRSVGMGVR